MKIALAATGTRGDVQPLIALAHTLRTRGHDVVLAASPSFAAQAEGLSFSPMGRDVDAWLRDEGGRLPATALSLFRLFNRALKSELEAQFKVLPELTRDVDVLIGAGALVAGGTVAESNRLPYRYAAFTTQSIQACEQMPTVLPFAGAPRWVNRLAWRACGWMYDRLFLTQFNSHRAQLGLAAARGIVDHFVPPAQIVLAADPELSGVTAAAGVLCTGAWQLPRTASRLPADIEAFLNQAPARPIFASFGSMPDPDPAATAVTLINGARRAGRRIIIGTPVDVAIEDDDVLAVHQPFSHELLFGRVDAVIHHGGAGTTATAARAGLAQIVVPHGGDQFGFARIAHELGIAPKPFARKRLTSGRLANAITEAAHLDVRSSARTLAATLNARPNGCEVMANHIEALHRAPRKWKVAG